MMTVLSQEAEARREPSGLQATLVTGALWSERVCRVRQEAVSQMMTVPSLKAEPGESAEVAFNISPERDLSYPGFDGRSILEPGTFILQVGGLSAEFVLD